MTDNELKDECMENAEIDLRRYSNIELTQIREAMRIYAASKLKLFAIPDVSGSASDFEKDLYKLINAHCKKGLKKPDLVHKMQYVTKSCELS